MKQLFRNSRRLFLSAVMIGLSLTQLSGQGSGFERTETPRERMERERRERMEQVERSRQQTVEETPEQRIERLKRELEEAELAARGLEDASKPETKPVAIPQGALVVVSSETSEGSGFIAEIKEKTFFVTNIHVLGAAKDASFNTVDGVAVPLSSVAFLSQKRDIAIVPISWDGPVMKVSRSLNFDEVGIGQKITVMGNTSGARVATRLGGEIRGMGPDEIEVSAKFEPGNSGSPIVHDELGTVVGVVSHMRDLSVKTKWTRDSEQADIRRFGYRLDGEIDWEQVTLDELYRQAAQFERFEDRTTAIAHISYMLQSESTLVTGYSNHASLGYLFEPFDKNFDWKRGTASSHNQRLMRQFIDRLMTELQSDQVEAEQALTIRFYRDRFRELRFSRDQVSRGLKRYIATRL